LLRLHSRSQILLPSRETRLLISQSSLKTRLSAQLLNAKSSRKVLFLRSLHRLLISKIGLETRLSTQLLNAKCCSQVLLTRCETRCLVKLCSLHLSRTICRKLLLSLLECLLTARGFDAT